MSQIVAIVALFGAGLTATLSPCVLPLVPGVVGVLTSGARVGRRIRAMLVFSLGAVVVFTLLGVTAGGLWSVGDSLGSGLQRIAGVILVVLALMWLAGRIGLVVPSVRVVRVLPDAPMARAFVLGVGCGAAWTPCAGPLLGAALTAAGSAAGSGGLLRSAVLLVAYAAGVLAPFVALATLGVRQVPSPIRTLGRVLSPVSAIAMVALGMALAFGWYDTLIARTIG